MPKKQNRKQAKQLKQEQQAQHYCDIILPRNFDCNLFEKFTKLYNIIVSVERIKHTKVIYHNNTTELPFTLRHKKKEFYNPASDAIEFSPDFKYVDDVLKDIIGNCYRYRFSKPHMIVFNVLFKKYVIQRNINVKIIVDKVNKREYERLRNKYTRVKVI